MCVGVLPADRLQKAGAAGAGNLLVLYGARTGRDGIGGASVLASQGFEEGSEDKRPSVQIGDPFTGKKLIECSLELLDAGVLVSLQDWARPASPRPRPRWPRRAVSASTSTCRRCRCARRAWSRWRS